MKAKLFLLIILLTYFKINAQLSFEDNIVAWKTNYGTNSADGPLSVDVSDLDGDRDLDVLIVAQNHDKIYWCENKDGFGLFSLPKIITRSPQTYARPKDVHSADIDGDGDNDVISSFQYYLIWNENIDGKGNFGPDKIILSGDLVLASSTTNFGSIVIKSGDFDGDGDIDIVFSSGNYNLGWFENLDGKGNFSDVKRIPYYVGGASIGINVTDIDIDGDLDIIAASVQGGHMSWFENIGGVEVFSAEKIITYDDALSVIALDLDNDGDKDILADTYVTLSSSVSTSNILVWYEDMDGNQNFSKAKIITNGQCYNSKILAVDLDNDNDLDIVSACKNTSTLSWYENINSNGSFGSEQIISTDTFSINDIHSADIDSDGDVDIISASTANDKTLWHKNNGRLNEISGVVKYASDVNNCNLVSYPMSNLMLVTTNGIDTIKTFSQSDGSFTFYVGEGNYNTSLQTLFSPLFNITPNSYDSNFVGIGSKDITNFCLIPTQITNDIDIVLLPITRARPGFNSKYQLVFNNKGTSVLNGNIILEFNNSKLTFLNASETISAQNNNSISFNYNDLKPFETRIIDLNFTIAAPPITEIGDVLNFTASINPIVTDQTEKDNHFVLNQTVIGSFDPNDIMVLEGEEILIEDAEEYLHYIIRFQNTGTADAINVVVKNILDSNLNWDTFQPESSSHSNRVEIKDNNNISFIFNGIYLPDSKTDEQNSHGFIAYKIKPKKGISMGDIMMNKADIFFDFNPEIKTNIVATKIASSLNQNDYETSNFQLYPNPTTGIITIKSKSKISEIQVFNKVGQTVLYEHDNAIVDVSSLNTGLYIIKIKNINGDLEMKKFVKK